MDAIYAIELLGVAQMFFVIDEWIMNRLEQATQKTEKFCGLDCFWWAKLCAKMIIPYSLACAGFVLWYEFPRMAYLPIYGISIATIIAALQMRPEIIETINNTERQVRENQEKGLMNPYRLRSDARFGVVAEAVHSSCIFGTIAILATFLFFLMEYLHGGAKKGVLAHVVFILTVIARSADYLGIPISYLISCNTAPRGKSKVRQWYESFHEAIKRFINPVPQPVS